MNHNSRKAMFAKGKQIPIAPQSNPSSAMLSMLLNTGTTNIIANNRNATLMISV